MQSPGSQDPNYWSRDIGPMHAFQQHPVGVLLLCAGSEPSLENIWANVSLAVSSTGLQLLVPQLSMCDARLGGMS